MQKMPRQYGSLLAVCELELDKTDPPTWFRVTTSIPGREGTMSQAWTWEGPRPHASQILDVVSFIDTALITAISLRCGWQEELFG